MENVDVVVFGKPGCGKCDDAKQKFNMMGFTYKFIDLLSPGDNWRENGVVDARATYSYNNEDTLPIIRFQHRLMTYPEAMKAAKTYLREHKEQLTQLLSIAS